MSWVCWTWPHSLHADAFLVIESNWRKHKYWAWNDELNEYIFALSSPRLNPREAVQSCFAFSAQEEAFCSVGTTPSVLVRSSSTSRPPPLTNPFHSPLCFLRHNSVPSSINFYFLRVFFILSIFFFIIRRMIVPCLKVLYIIVFFQYIYVFSPWDWCIIQFSSANFLCQGDFVHDKVKKRRQKFMTKRFGSFG